jgi:transcriptional regulator with XRE-family HTH domain
VTEPETPEADGDPLTIGDRIRAARALRNLSADKLALRTARGIGRTKILAWENGTEEPEQWHLDEIARAVGVGPGWWTLDFSGLGLPPYIDRDSLMRDVDQRLADQDRKLTELLDKVRGN